MVCAHAITRNRRTTRNGHTHRFPHRWNSIWIMGMAKTLVIGAYVCVVCCWSGGETFYSGAAQISEWESQGVYASHVCACKKKAPGLAIDQSKQRAPMTNGHVCTANNNPQSTIIIANNNINDIHINFSFSLSTHTHTHSPLVFRVALADNKRQHNMSLVLDRPLAIHFIPLSCLRARASFFA